MIEENHSSRDLEQLFGSRLKEKEKQMKTGFSVWPSLNVTKRFQCQAYHMTPGETSPLTHQ